MTLSVNIPNLYVTAYNLELTSLKLGVAPIPLGNQDMPDIWSELVLGGKCCLQLPSQMQMKFLLEQRGLVCANKCVQHTLKEGEWGKTELSSLFPQNPL